MSTLGPPKTHGKMQVFNPQGFWVVFSPLKMKVSRGFPWIRDCMTILLGFNDAIPNLGGSGLFLSCFPFNRAQKNPVSLELFE